MQRHAVTVHAPAAHVHLLEQILGSRTFAKSPRLARFLEFICTELFEGRAEAINEQQIGVHVFGRSATYSAVDDSIVRTQARLLRQRLEDYFENEAASSTLILCVPKGGYVPVFETRRRVAKEPALPLQSAEEAGLRRLFALRLGRRQMALLIAVMAVLVVSAGLFSLAVQRHREPQSATEAFWSEIFTQGRTVLIVPSDDGLVLFQEFTRQPVSLNEYLNGTYLNHALGVPSSGVALNADWFAAHQYTSSEDLKLALRLGRVKEAGLSNVETRDARALRIEDLKKGNNILIGGSGANPWVGLFADRLNFDVGWDWKNSEGFVRNKRPAVGESGLYRDALSSDGVRRSYGVLAFLPGIDGNGVTLLFEGTGMAGTESAADFLFSSGRFESFARSIGATPRHVPYFEVLLETTSVAGNAPEAHVLAWRILPPTGN